MIIKNRLHSNRDSCRGWSPDQYLCLRWCLHQQKPRDLSENQNRFQRDVRRFWFPKQQQKLYIFLVSIFFLLPFTLVAQSNLPLLSIGFEEDKQLIQQTGILFPDSYSVKEGFKGKGIQLNDSTSAVHLSDLSQFAGEFTLLFWFKPDGKMKGKQTLFFAEDSLSSFEVFFEAGALGVTEKDDRTSIKNHVSLIPSYQNDQWYLFTLSVTPCAFWVSVGCKEVLKAPLAIPVFQRTTFAKSVFVGNSHKRQVFTGELDEIVLFKSSLSISQRKWFCAQNTLPSYLPTTENSTNSVSAEPASKLQEQKPLDKINWVQKKEISLAMPWTWSPKANTEYSRPLNGLYGTWQFSFFMEDFSEKIILASEKRNESFFTLVADSTSLLIKTTTDSVRLKAGWQALQENKVILEFEGCMIKLQTGCGILDSIVLEKPLLGKAKQNVEFNAQKSFLISQLSYFPSKLTEQQKRNFLCKKSNLPNQEDSAQKLLQLFDTRKSYIEQKPIQVSSVTVFLSFWDFDRIDGDTISAIFNDEVILQYHGLTAEKVTKEIQLNSNQSNTLKLFAHSNGSEGNNTVKVGILSGGGVYQEVDITTEALLNGGIILEHNPKSIQNEPKN